MSTIFQHGNDGKRDTLVVTTPPHFPTMHTRETVTFLAAFGLDENQIAAILRCTSDDVRRYYQEELEHGLTRVNARVMSAVLHQALQKEDVNAMKLWLINKAGWRGGDGNRTNILNAPGTGADGETISVVQRREIITKLLVTATQHKRQVEHIIDAQPAPVKKNGANGNGHANGANGNGTGGSNGAKHR